MLAFPFFYHSYIEEIRYNNSTDTLEPTIPNTISSLLTEKNFSMFMMSLPFIIMTDSTVLLSICTNDKSDCYMKNAHIFKNINLFFRYNKNIVISSIGKIQFSAIFDCQNASLNHREYQNLILRKYIPFQKISFIIKRSYESLH